MRVSFRWVILAGLVLLAGCSSLNPFSRKAPVNEPAALVQFAPSMATRTVWTARIGKSGDYPLVPAVVDARVYAASADGEISCLDAADGKLVWKIKAGTELTAGVGTDGKVLVVVGVDGLILAFDAADGKPLWKAQASTEVLSTPALGSGVVVVRSMDNRIAAYDLASGTRRWFVQRTAPPLALRASPGILIHDGIAFVALPAGRLLALAAQTGAPRWDAPIAEPRGATELERVADVSGMPALMGRDVCAASYQGRLACVDAGNGSVRWARELSADVGPGLDQRYVFASDERGNLQAFSRDSGSSLWRNTSLSWRGLSSPVSFGRAVVVGDRQGYVHFFSREEGALLARVQTDGSAIRATPVVAGSTLIVQSQNGSLLAISTE
ncbi:MAG: outer membrane protein assembly factor BamB [Pseudomonadota bacterium]|jgi:outer membrane protein assembly factor BamB